MRAFVLVVVRRQRAVKTDMRETNRYAAPYLCLVWFTVLFLLAYWFRAVEVTACQLKGKLHATPCTSAGANVWSVIMSGFVN